MTLDVEAVRDAIDPARLAEALGLEVRLSGGQLRGRRCPATTHGRADTFAMSASTALWCCHSCNSRGDAFGLVAAMLDLDVRGDFPRVVRETAALAGIVVDDTPDRAARLAELARAGREARARQETARRRQETEAAAALPEVWRGLSRDHRPGWFYCLQRGIDPVPLVERDRLRFDARGPAVPLWSPDGRLANVVVRIVDDAAFGRKIDSQRGCTTSGTLLDRIDEIAPGTTVVVTEGLADTLTAANRRIWGTSKVVLGANGAGQLEAVVRAAAPRIVACKARIVIVHHDDQEGERGATRAAEAAVEAGIAIEEDDVIDLGAKDLNTAYLAGWTPGGAA